MAYHYRPNTNYSKLLTYDNPFPGNALAFEEQKKTLSSFSVSSLMFFRRFKEQFPSRNSFALPDPGKFRCKKEPDCQTLRFCSPIPILFTLYYYTIVLIKIENPVNLITEDLQKLMLFQPHYLHILQSSLQNAVPDLLLLSPNRKQLHKYHEDLKS